MESPYTRNCLIFGSLRCCSFTIKSFLLACSDCSCSKYYFHGSLHYGLFKFQHSTLHCVLLAASAIDIFPRLAQQMSMSRRQWRLLWLRRTDEFSSSDRRHGVRTVDPATRHGDHAGHPGRLHCRFLLLHTVRPWVKHNSSFLEHYSSGSLLSA